MAEQECPSSGCEGCSVEGCGDRTATGPVTKETNAVSNVKHVIGVLSGKGGVGKSLVTGLLAANLHKRGYNVAILDADVTGPSVPKLFGVYGHVQADENGINPAQTKTGIRLISTNLMLPQEDMPVIWRGPVVSGVITQFWSEVNWGDIDIMLVDMPPGTSDVALTVFQSLPIDGMITVSAPQELVAMIVGKAVNMAKSMDVSVLGLVENMAYFQCDECGKKHYVYGEPQGKFVAKHYGIPAYATLPIDPRFAQLCDAGQIEEYDVGDMLDPIIEQVEITIKSPVEEAATE